MITNIKLVLPTAVILLCTGCATILNGTDQPLSVETRLKGTQVAGATCKLENDKGTWFVTAPGSTTVHRSAKDLTVRCEKENFYTGSAFTPSSTKAMVFGNILFGGIIGAGVDTYNGAAFDYPTLIQVEMNEIILATPLTPQTAADKISATTTQ